MKKLIKYLKPYRFLAIVSPLMMIGEVLADLLLPYLTTFLVNYGIEGISVTDPEHGSEIAFRLMTLFGVGDGERMKIILLFGILMLCITLVGGFFGVLCAWTAATAAQGFGRDLRRDAFGRVMSLSIEQTDRFTTGSLVTRMTNDVSMIVDFVEQILRMFVRAPMFLVGGTVALLLLNVKFGFVLACAIPILLVMLGVILFRAVPIFDKVQKKLDRVNSIVQENVSGARVVKAYVREDYEGERFDKANRELRDTNYSVLRLLSVISPVLTVIMNFAIAAVIFIGGWQIRIGEAGMSVGTIMAAITYITQVIMSVMMVTMMFQSVSRALASAKRVSEVLETEPVIRGGKVGAGNGIADNSAAENSAANRFTAENSASDGLTEGHPAAGDALAGSDPVPPTQPTDPAHVTLFPGDNAPDPVIRFSDVSFRYPGTAGDDVLKHIDLTVRRGEVLAVIGATGTGKSSLVSLIPRFYDSTSGEVFVDGVPVRDYDLTVLRKKIGFVMQKSELFSDTVENNIKWGKPDATREEVLSAAHTAQADGFIEGFAGGFDSFIAEKGASLSGGQKQRISIARALVRCPEILILDDSTSALDLSTEAKLRRALRERMKGTTVILIAQRIASVKEADRIAVLEADGSIRHCAPHEDLLRVSETYRDICASQARQLRPETPGTPAKKILTGGEEA